MGGGVKTLVIHLDRAVGRRAQVDRLLAEAPWPAEILPAVDGAALEDWPVLPRFRPRYPFTLRAGEVGCFLSHRAAWQRIVDEGWNAALILEDDVALEPGFDAVAQFAAQHVAQFGYIQLQTRPLTGVEVARDGELAIVRAPVTPLRTSAQLVHVEAAQRLLAVTPTFDRPVDTMLQMHWETGVRVHTAVPSRVADRTAETGGSTISGPSRGLWANLRREVKRGLYRAAIRRLSR